MPAVPQEQRRSRNPTLRTAFLSSGCFTLSHHDVPSIRTILFPHSSQRSRPPLRRPHPCARHHSRHIHRVPVHTHTRGRRWHQPFQLANRAVDGRVFATNRCRYLSAHMSAAARRAPASNSCNRSGVVSTSVTNTVVVAVPRADRAAREGVFSRHDDSWRDERAVFCVARQQMPLLHAARRESENASCVVFYRLVAIVGGKHGHEKSLRRDATSAY
mmetsp:Transcript_79883/g.117032  ORF Transcript_79883/g.117032 Transcript_79883/m.117032 type:complete len:216 (+) Transcript_79883:632-1279(+)